MWHDFMVFSNETQRILSTHTHISTIIIWVIWRLYRIYIYIYIFLKGYVGFRVSQNQEYVLRVPIIRVIIFGGLYVGSPT